MNVSEFTIQNLISATWVEISQQNTTGSIATTVRPRPKKPDFDPLFLLKQKLDQIKITNPQLAHWLCEVIPAQCPFERDVKLFGKVLFHIPPLCKLNPLYEQLVSLRFRALCYLADECGEDITTYC